MKLLIKPLIFIVIVGVAWWYGYRCATDAWKLKWLQRDAFEAQEIIRHEKSVRNEEQRRQKVTENEIRDTARKLAQIRQDTIDAQRAADGMQRQLKQLRLQLARSETRQVSTATTTSQANSKANMVLTQLLGEIDSMAGKYAEEADRAYATGISCERIYHSVTGHD